MVQIIEVNHTYYTIRTPNPHFSSAPISSYLCGFLLQAQLDFDPARSSDRCPGVTRVSMAHAASASGVDASGSFIR
jgi:hypothetical protein